MMEICTGLASLTATVGRRVTVSCQGVELEAERPKVKVSKASMHLLHIS